ncbi:MAG: GatB/YqeY domain-containing protein [Chloroflexota bacterium]|nr:GatB/YqeY domain-containing protein [Anaerolineales bacterium]RLD04625.1 MAG: GatB/YqeY domain-containing protein [Chloroflexota bacterium]
MSIKKQLRDALTEALRSGETQRKTTLRMALASIKNAEVEAREELEEDLVLNLIQKEVKARQETIEAAKKAQRPDLIEKAEQEIKILNEFLPQQLSAEELRVLVQEAVQESGASSMAEIGKVMGALMPKIRGRADGKQANQIVRELLGAE